MGRSVSARAYKAKPSISVSVVLGARASRAGVYVSSGALGDVGDVPTGHLGLRLGVADLVGLTPARATLKVLEAVTRTLRHIVAEEADSARPKAPAPPAGATGAAVQVPGQMMLSLFPSDPVYPRGS